MDDRECVEFLQWALPRMGMRWPGFRRVRRQVRRRIGARLEELGLADGAAYRAHLEAHPGEWIVLDDLCRVTVSRFFRNHGVFRFLLDLVLPERAEAAARRGDDRVRVWSVGCASGEEPYTLAIGWRLEAGDAAGGMPLEILATDADAHMIGRAEAAVYPPSSLRELPERWRRAVFEPVDGGHRLKARYRRDVRFRREDVREAMPEGRFDMVLCRNLVFTYFAEAVQQRLLEGLAASLVDGAALVLGHHERLPAGAVGFAPWKEDLGLWRRTGEAEVS